LEQSQKDLTKLNLNIIFISPRFRHKPNYQ